MSLISSAVNTVAKSEASSGAQGVAAADTDSLAQRTPTPQQIQWLRDNPTLYTTFEEHYGPGSSAQYLKADVAAEKAALGAEQAATESPLGSADMPAAPAPAPASNIAAKAEATLVDGARDVVAGAAFGVAENITQSAKTVAGLLNWGVAKYTGVDNWFEPANLTQMLEQDLKVRRPTSKIGGLSAGVSQFAFGFAGALRLFGVKLATAANATRGQKIANFAKVSGVGAFVDAFEFDPYGEVLSDWVQQNYPDTADDFYTALSTDPTDPEWEARAKKAAEGLVLGGVVEVAAIGVKMLRGLNLTKKAKQRALTEAEQQQLIADAEGIFENPPGATFELPPGSVDASPRTFEVPPDGVNTVRNRNAAVPGETRAKKQVGQGVPKYREQNLTPDVDIHADAAKELAEQIVQRGPDDLLGAPRQQPDFVKLRADLMSRDDGFTQSVMTALETRLKDQPVVSIGDIQKQAREQAFALGVRPEEYVNRIVETKGAAGFAAHVQARQYVATALSEELGARISRAAVDGFSDPKVLEDLAVALQRAQDGIEAAQFARAEAGRGLRILQEDRSGSVALVRQLSKLSTDRKDALVKLAELSRKKGADPLQLLRAMTEAPNSRSTLDFAQQLFKNSILSGPATHIVNAASNGIKLANSSFENVLRGVARGDGVVHSLKREAVSVAYSAKALRSAIQASRMAFIKGEGVLDAATRVDDRGYNLKNLNELTQSIESGNGWQAMLSASKTLLGDASLRVLGSSDELFKQISYNAAVSARAYDDAINLHGLKDPADIARYIENRAAAAVDPVTGRALDRDALEYARQNTFTQNLRKDTVISSGGAMVRQALGANNAVSKALQFVVPFVKTPTNIIEDFWQRSPLNMNLYRDIAFGSPEVRADALARFTTGMVYTGLAFELFASDRIAGGGPADPVLRKAWLANHQPYSVKVGDKWVSFGRLDPSASHLAVVADALELADLASESERADIMRGVGVMFARQFANKTYLKNIGELMTAIMDPEMKADERIVQNVAGAVIPSLVSTFNGDEYMREVRSITDAIKNRVPGYAPSLPVQRNFLGEPILTSEDGRLIPIATRTDREDRAMEEVIGAFEKSGRSFGGTAATVDGVDWREFRAVNPETGFEETAYDVLQRELGSLEPRKALIELTGSPSWAKLTPDARANLVSTTIQKYRTAARNRVLAKPEFDGLRKEMLREKLAKRGAPKTLVESLK